jgi:large subunit ribosomal protein L24
MKKIKIGDNAKVIQGKDKGQIGKIKIILHKKGKVVVDGINKKIKHIKSSQKNKVGKIVNFNAPLSISNIMLCDNNGLVSKVKFILKDNRKVRVFKKTNELMK